MISERWDIHDKTKLIECAFLLGFMISKEGFNGEYPQDSLAPDELEPYGLQIEDFIELIKDGAIQALLGQAIHLLGGDPLSIINEKFGNELVALFNQKGAGK